MNNNFFYLNRAIRFSLYSLLFIVLSCRIQIAPIGIIGGLFIGWKSIEYFYILRKGKMSLIGDLQYFITLGVLILLSVQILPFACGLASSFQECSPQLKVGCTFIFSFSTGIASFSLWLWLRWRGDFILLEQNRQ